MKIKLDITTAEAKEMLTLFGEALHLVSRSMAMGMAPSSTPTAPYSSGADADVDADSDDPTVHGGCDGPSEQGIDPDDLPFVPGPLPDIEFGVPRNPFAPAASAPDASYGENMCFGYGLTHKAGMARTVEVVCADVHGVTLGMRGRSELPAVYADAPQVTLVWPEDDQRVASEGKAVLARLFDAWFSYSYAKTTAPYMTPAEESGSDTMSALPDYSVLFDLNACGALLEQMAKDGGDLRAKQAIVFTANACLNRAAWHWLLDLRRSGMFVQRFPAWSYTDTFDLADKLAGDIAAGVQGFWPEWTLFLDITPNWRKLHITQEQA
jgi:hypothetical protein